MAGCDPQLNLAGAYIPGWLACLVGGLFGFWVIHVIFRKTGIHPFVRPLALVYAAAISFLTCLIWLLFFASR
jgi:uncharacterized membrane protein YsdA (DUF1294 family)